MIISTLEGHATVEALGVSHTAVAGTSVRVKLGADMKPIAPPSLPESYPLADVQNLPIGNLQREIAIHMPLTDAEVALVQQQQQAQVIVSNATNPVAAVSNTAATVNNTVATVGNTVGDTVTGSTTTAGNNGGSTNTNNGSSGNSGDNSGGGTGSGNDNGGNSGGSNGDDGGGLIDTILHLPCILLQCKP
jgi:hypothetical protein